MTETLTDGGEGGGVAVATAAAYPDDIRQLGDLIASLKPDGAKATRLYLEDEYGIEASGGTVVMDEGQPSPPINIIEEQTAFDVVLAGYDDAKKMAVIKEFRAIVGSGLAESKAGVEGTKTKPFTVKEGLPRPEAEALAKRLTDAGGKVELK